jgi:cellulose 1,4-beta-cellobiosidase
LPGAGSGTSAPVASSAAATTPTVPTTFRTSKTAGGSTAASSAAVTASPGDSSNPLKGKSFYANPFYASEVLSLAAPSLVAAGSTALAAKATNVAKVGTFYWL